MLLHIIFNLNCTPVCERITQSLQNSREAGYGGRLVKVRVVHFNNVLNQKSDIKALWKKLKHHSVTEN